MKWTKHMTDCHRDPAVRQVINEFGIEGYGLYWILIGEIAGNMKNNLPELELTPANWRKISGFSPKKFQKFVRFLSDFSLLYCEFSSKTITVGIPNILKIRDEYSQRTSQISGQSPDSTRDRARSASASVSIIPLPVEGIDTLPARGDFETHPNTLEKVYYAN